VNDLLRNDVEVAMYSGIQKLGNLLLVSVSRDLLDDEVIRMRREILRAIREHGSEIVVLDFHVVDICDSFFGRFIYSTSKTVELMGTRVIISGLQDSVIETMVELGMTLPEVQTVFDLDEAIRLTRQWTQDGSDFIPSPINEISETLEHISGHRS
jgi:rsbT antagonist protein RsbS